MGQEAELKVSSDSVKQLSIAVEALVSSLEKLSGKSIKAEKNTKKVNTTVKRTGKTAKASGKDVNKFQERLKEMGNSAQLVTGPLGGIASRIAVIGRVAKTGTIVMVGLAVAATLLTKGLTAAGEAADRSNLLLEGLNAQVKATGEAAGLTGKQLDQFARRLAFATLDSHDGVVKLTRVMLTFRDVSGETFKDAIRLSQDLGIAMSQDPVTAAKTLGRVLNDPVKNFKQLKRAGIEFNATQVIALKDARRSGDFRAEQKIIIDEVSKSVKGLAKAQNDSLAGDRDAFSQKWDLLAETIGKTVLPALRAAVQFSNDFLDVLQEIVETDPETAARRLAESGELTGASIESLNSKRSDGLVILAAEIKELKALKVAREEDIAASKAASKASVDAAIAAAKSGKLTSGFATVQGQSGRTVVDVAREARAIEAANVKIAISSNTLIQIADELASREAQATAANVVKLSGLQEEFIATEKRIASQKRLNDIFAKTGRTRDKEFRDEVARQKATEIANKALIGLKSDEFEAIFKQIKVQSDLTEERVRANTVFQIQRGLENKTRGLELQIELHDALRNGLSKNSIEYLKLQSAIEAKNKALQAGFAVGTKEHDQIVQLSNDLVQFKIKLLDIQNLRGIGLTAINGFEIASTEIVRIQQELAVKLQLIEDSAILAAAGNEQKKIDAIAEVRKQAAEEESEVLGIDVRIDDDGIATIISELQANEEAKNLALQEIRRFAQENDLLQHEDYLRRKNEITQEYEDKAGEIAQKNFEATNAHKQRLRQIDIANGIAAGLENLAAVAGNNKRLAKMAKIAALFSASTSLVEALSNAAALPFPANIAAYIKAGVQGTQLIQQASQLNEPSFAFGGVNIKGRGTGRSDDIHARISRGESVMTQAATANYTEVLKRMNAGLPITGNFGGSGNSISFSPSIIIQGDASSKTITAIDERLALFEDRVLEISRGASLEILNEENEVGGVLNPI